MRLLLFIILYSWGQTACSQDSVKATVIKTAEKTVVFKMNGYRFVSFDCKCDRLKKGDVFMIPKARYDSLLLEAKPIRRKDINN